MTAEEARKISEKAKTTPGIDYDSVCDKIKKAANKGESSVHIDEVSNQTTKKLRQDGFTVRQVSGRYNDIHTYIGW